MGNWENSPHILAISEKCKKDIFDLNTYGEIAIQYVDTIVLKKIIDENENTFSAVINVIDTFSLPEVDKVDNSSIILCNAEELLKLLISQEGIIRKNLFDDNVRDFQGDTSINSDIFQTIETDPLSFILLNNGITIVCDEIGIGNRKVTIKNPQIVNGCQTCNVIYQAKKRGLNLSGVTLISKIIATRSLDIANNIVKGTNRQNIVYDEAFEITRQFHKELEDVFSALSAENSVRLFYERRSKQFFDNPSVKPFEKVNLRGVIQSFVSIFLNEPFKGHRHESKLLQEFRNKIFIDSQSKYPYYIAALMLSKVEQAYRSNIISKEIFPYKMHLCWILKEVTEGNSPNINNEKEMDKYCENILLKLLDTSTLSENLEKSCKMLLEIQNQWIVEKGEKHKYGMKDSQDFFNYLREKVNLLAEGTVFYDEPLQYRGTVIKIGLDRNGMYYGFISKIPNNIFFHERENSKLNFSDLHVHDVLYTVKQDSVTGNEKAVNVQLI